MERTNRSSILRGQSCADERPSVPVPVLSCNATTKAMPVRYPQQRMTRINSSLTCSPNSLNSENDAEVAKARLDNTKITMPLRLRLRLRVQPSPASGRGVRRPGPTEQPARCLHLDGVSSGTLLLQWTVYLCLLARGRQAQERRRIRLVIHGAVS